MLTNVINNTFITFRISGSADVAAVQQNPVVGIWQEFRQDAFQKTLFNCLRGIAFCKANLR